MFQSSQGTFHRATITTAETTRCQTSKEFSYSLQLVGRLPVLGRELPVYLICLVTLTHTRHSPHFATKPIISVLLHLPTNWSPVFDAQSVDIRVTAT